MSSIIQYEEQYKKVCSYIINTGSVAAWAYCKNNSYHQSIGPCHASVMTLFGTKGDYKYFASVMASKSNLDYLKDQVNDYTSWLVSPDSPYECIHKNNVELIKDEEGNNRGFILGEEAMNVDNLAGVYNLLVAARISRDQPQIIQNYGGLRSIGLSNLQSFILSPYFSKNKDVWVKTNAIWQASHQPFREFYTRRNVYETFYHSGTRTGDWKGRLDGVLGFKKLLNKEYDFKLASVNNSSLGWIDTSIRSPKVIDDYIQESTITKTRFSKLSSVNEDSIRETARGLFE